MNRSKLALLAVVCTQVAACTPTPGGSTPTGATPSTGAAPAVATGNVSTAVSYAAFPPIPAVPAAKVVGVHLVTRPGGASLADLDKDTSFDDSYAPEVNTTFTADDSATPAASTLKVRGHSTRLTDQKSYAITLAKDAPAWHGDRNVNLNKHPYDLTRLRNKLSFDLFAGLKELPALQAEFTTLDIDKKPFGLFTLIEEPDKGFLRRLKLDEKGQFYKAQQFSFDREAALKNVGEAGYDEKAFEKVLSIKGEKNHAKLLAMLDALADESKPINNIVAGSFDRANYVTWLATQILLENLDTNSQNFYLYSPQASNVWTFVPWDYDGAWGFYEQPNELAGNGKPARWTEGVGNWWNVALHRRFLSDPGNLAQVVARADELADGYFTPARIQAYVDSYKGVVRPAILKDPDAGQLPLDGSANPGGQWDAEVARLAKVVAARRALLHDSLERPMPFWLGDPEGKRFHWDAAVDLQGDAVTYDFQLSKTTAFAKADLLVDKSGLKDTNYTLVENVPAGTYFWRVVARDAKDPAKNWQIPFTHYESADGKQRVDGAKQVTL